MDGKKTTLPHRLSEVEAHQLLARAAELDARSRSSVTTELLSAAALEAGISAEAFAKAAAELAAGKLGSPARGAWIRASIVTISRVAISGVLTWWLLVDPKRPFAQGIALAFAVFGAYKCLGWLSRGLSQGLKATTAGKAAIPVKRPPDSKGDHTSLSVRLFAVPGAARGAA